MQIEVVVTYFQVRTLKADVEKASIEQPLGMDSSILRDRDAPRTQPSPRLSKGNGGEDSKAWVKQPLVQIAVVVAHVQMRTSKADVGKGSV